MQQQSYRELIVWQKAMELVVAVYGFTATFPKEELYGLVSQMKRAAVSIPSNIAEGSRKNSNKDTGRFFEIAFGSSAELETQIEICKRVSLGDQTALVSIELQLSEIMRILNTMTQKYRDS